MRGTAGWLSAPPDVPRRLRAALGAWGCCAALLLAASPALAQWKWRDASGVIHFSDRPPPTSVPDIDILHRPRGTRSPAAGTTEPPAPAASAASAARPAETTRPSSAIDRQLEARRKAAEEARLASAKAEEQRQAALRAENCSRARSALATLDSGQRVTRMNEKGEREFLDDRQRAEEARRAREVIASDCR